MIKAIFFDIDGTLLSKKNQRITKELKATLDKARDKGILLFVATGRHNLEIQNLKLKEDYCFDGYLTLNGCYCYNDKEIIYQADIDKQDITNIIDLLKQTDIACMFVEGKDMYINKINQRVIKAQADIHTPVPDVLNIERALKNDIYQIIPYVTKEEIKPFLEVTKNCRATSWHPLAYDIIPLEGGKSKGVEATLQYYGLQREEVMAFGDGHNDIDMLEYVGLGICMENGEEVTKKASDFITKSVDDKGIEYALKHFSVL